MRPAIVVMSHGNMAQETVNSAKMIVGALENVAVVSMQDADGLAGTNEKLTTILETWGTTAEMLVLADLKGGTPCNVALMKMADYPNLRVVAGLNLAMLIEGVMATEESADALAKYLEGIGRSAVEKIQLPSLADDEDEYEE